MKKTILFIISIVLIVMALLLSKFYTYKENYNSTKEANLRYEKYLEKEIKGTDIATIINQAIDDNEDYYIKKDEKGKYLQDDENSVNVEIKITDFKDEKIYTMETLYNGGMNEFVKYYGQISFKCSEKKYHKNGKIKYILFEQMKS